MILTTAGASCAGWTVESQRLAIRREALFV